MRDKPQNSTTPPRQATSSEYGDALSDILKDQARRKDLRRAPGPKPRQRRLHPIVPPVLALVSIWLWAFPPAALRPVVPTIPLANQEAGLRMEMVIQAGKILQYLEENGHLPDDLQEVVGDSPDAVRYMALAGNVFQLTGETGEITITFTSTEPLEGLLADALNIVSGTGSATTG